MTETLDEKEVAEVAYLRIELEAAREHLRLRDEFIKEVAAQVVALQRRVEELEARAEQFERDAARVDRVRQAMRRVPGAYPILRALRTRRKATRG